MGLQRFGHNLVTEHACICRDRWVRRGLATDTEGNSQTVKKEIPINGKASITTYLFSWDSVRMEVVLPTQLLLAAYML